MRVLHPQIWKTGRLVLLQKPGKPANTPSAYRPIVLLNEAGKLLERIVAARLIRVRYLTTTGPDRADAQHGFREGRSTIDAISGVKSFAQEDVARGKVVMAIPLDISNAFNTLSFECIEEGLRYHAVPVYFRKLIENYLRGRNIKCVNWDGSVVVRSMSCCVPQGSVLGPTLWNIGYNWVLRGAFLRGLSFVTQMTPL
jgi:hypothetical protein